MSLLEHHTFHYLTVLHDKAGYSLLSVPTKTRERADFIRGWWPWKSKVQKWESTGCQENMVAVRLTKGVPEPVTLWVFNGQQAQMLLSAWVSKKGRAGMYKDYTLRCLCGGRFVTGTVEPGAEVCEQCKKKPRFKLYKGPWNLPGGVHKVEPVRESKAKEVRCEPKTPKRETKTPKRETKAMKQETKKAKREAWGSLL